MRFTLRESVLWFGITALGIGGFVSPWGIGAQEKSDRKLVRKVDPTYPPLASQLKLSGSVKMVVQISSDGKVENVHTTGGSPILAAAAENAVKQWKYEAAPKESSEVVTVTFEGPK